MNDIICSEQDFYQQRQQYGRLSFLLVFLVFLGHLLVFAGSFFLPSFFERQPVIHEIMTIDLVSLSEPAIARASLPETEPVLEPENISPLVPEPPSVEAVAIEPVTETFQEPVVTAKPVSLTPLKTKETIAVDTRLEEEKLLADQRQIEERMRNLRAEADLRKQQREKRERQKEERERLAEQKQREEEARKQEIARARVLEQQARDEAERARQELARFHKIRESAGMGGRETFDSQRVSNILLNQYTANLYAVVERYWQLPGMRQWPEDIEAIVEFTVYQDGSISGLRISSGSGDPFFDRFAKETVKKALPLPPIPAALRKKSIDYGLVFNPSGIQ